MYFKTDKIFDSPFSIGNIVKSLHSKHIIHEKVVWLTRGYNIMCIWYIQLWIKWRENENI